MREILKIRTSKLDGTGHHERAKKCFRNINYKFLKYFDNDFLKLRGKFETHLRNRYRGENTNLF